MRHAIARLVAVLLLAGLAVALTSCDLPGQSTGNGYQRVSNSIP